jgi:hypothetical protein
MVLQDGFAWNGATYRSLSEVARAITTRWNGPRFFSLSRGTEAGRAGSGRATVINQCVNLRTRPRAGPDKAAHTRLATSNGSREVSP